MDNFFILANSWLISGTWIAALGAFAWGMISVMISPCHMASIPLIVAYVGGQDEVIQGKQGVKFAVFFSCGLFITIAIVGIACALLGRMLGDVGPYWTLLIGIILLWVAADMLGVAKCSMPSSIMGKMKVKGSLGAFVLGLAYGMLSGSCTFGFIAPILAIITVQQKIATGTMLIILFGIGHCLPIAVAGSSTATVKKLLANSTFGQSAIWFKKGAGALIAALGIYFVSSPFV
ncbi:MAG: cytochrome c biogenesis protein CcdA [Desulfobulbaceae bacterium]|nr:cytochrome c biogenesis protein CcdA [Desulfobulbaceae bacterium]